MKLFIVAALVSVAAAGRLEHLERAYLPPFGSGSQGSDGAFGSGSNQFRSAHGGFPGSLDSNRIESSASGRLNGFGSSPFAGATSNQYLPPDHGPSGSQFSGSLQGFGGQRSQYSAQPFGASPQAFGSSPQSFGSQYSAPSSQFGAAPSFGSQYSAPSSQFGAAPSQGRYQQLQSQFPSANRQYLAPKASSFDNIPQQPFDEETGYHY